MLPNPSRSALCARIPVFFVAVGLLAAPSRAADPVFDAKGFDQRRETISQLPFEHVDPLTGNLLLTFTDLVLPGNAGFDLRIQRTYNAKIYDTYVGAFCTTLSTYSLEPDSWAGIGWRVHQGLVRHLLTTPVIEMPDGSQHQAFPHIDGSFTHFITRDFWTFDKGVNPPVLRLPNGVKYFFDHGDVDTKYVTRIEDAFGNSIVIDYVSGASAPLDGIREIRQYLSTSQVRTVSFTYTPTIAGHQVNALHEMTFNNKTWTYTQERAQSDPGGYTVLTSVQAPVDDQPWRFEYYAPVTGSTKPYLLNVVTTPGGGTLTYDYAPKCFYSGSSVIFTPALWTRDVAGRAVTAGRWAYAYESLGEFDPVTTTITEPCRKVVYEHYPIGEMFDEQPWRIGSLKSKKIFESNGTVALETQTFTWTPSDRLNGDYAKAKPEYAPLVTVRQTPS